MPSCGFCQSWFLLHRSGHPNIPLRISSRLSRYRFLSHASFRSTTSHCTCLLLICSSKCQSHVSNLSSDLLHTSLHPHGDKFLSPWFHHCTRLRYTCLHSWSNKSQIHVVYLLYIHLRKINYRSRWFFLSRSSFQKLSVRCIAKFCRRRICPSSTCEPSHAYRIGNCYKQLLGLSSTPREQNLPIDLICFVFLASSQVAVDLSVCSSFGIKFMLLLRICFFWWQIQLIELSGISTHSRGAFAGFRSLYS